MFIPWQDIITNICFQQKNNLLEFSPRNCYNSQINKTMAKENLLYLIDTFYNEINVLNFLIDEGYVTEELKLTEGLTIKELNERLEEEVSIEKAFASKKDFKKWLITLSNNMKDLSGLIKFTVE